MSLRRRVHVLRSERGIGLIELLIALTILIVGVGATTAVFASSLIDLGHAGKEGTAITLADRQLESYRAMPYSCIPTTLPQTAPSGCLSPSGFPNPYAATQTTTSSESPDHRIYTVTTALSTPSAGTTQIQVSVSLSGGGGVLATQTSYFSSNGTSSSG